MRKRKWKQSTERRPNAKREQSPRDNSGGLTLGDTLSPAMKACFGELREGLAQRARETIKTQLAKPAPPWHVTPAVKQKPNLQHGNATRIKKEDNIRNANQFQFWEFPPDIKVRETPPKHVSLENRYEFNRIVSATAPASEATEGQLLFVTIGLDFGTSATKIIVRFPYEAGEPTVAIPAPGHSRSSKHPYLWQTALWLLRGGEFALYPEQDANLLYALKQGVMREDPDAPATPEGSEPNGVTRIEAAVAYLTYVIRYVRGWLICNRSDLFRGRRPNWFVNLGLPAASYDNETLVQAYREAAAGALMLANSGEAVSMEAIRTFLRDEIVKDAAQSRESAEALGIAVIPEVAAAATAFAKSTGAAPGLYLLVDVGATTLDACTFWLGKGLGEDSGDGYSLFNADVRPLGVEAFHWFWAQGRTEGEFREQCDYCLHKVVWDTKCRRCPRADCWNEGDVLPVFFTGGGSRKRSPPPYCRRVTLLAPRICTE